MKHKLIVLLFTPFLLTSCGGGTPSQVTIPLENGGHITLTNEQLSQDDYFGFVNNLYKPKTDYKYTLKMSKFGGEAFNYTIAGDYASYKSSSNNVSESVDVYTGKVNKCSFVSLEERSVDYQKLVDTRLAGEYCLYNNQLDFGSLYEWDEKGYVYINNPNVPIAFPTPDSEKTNMVKTSIDEYLASRMQLRFDSYKFINHGANPFVLEATFTDSHFIDKPVFSHRLTSRYVVIEEKRKAIPVSVVAPNDNVRYAFYMSLIQSGRYYNSTHYYNNRTGKLEKTECSFESLDPYFIKNTEIACEYTIEYRDRNYNQAKNDFDKYKNQFLKFDGVITKREERQSQ